MAACTLCSAPNHEVVGHRGQTTPSGNYHNDCSYLAYLLFMATKSPVPFEQQMVQKRIDHLVAKRQGTPTEFP